jgi:hypothetical protein
MHRHIYLFYVPYIPGMVSTSNIICTSLNILYYLMMFEGLLVWRDRGEFLVIAFAIGFQDSGTQWQRIAKRSPYLRRSPASDHYIYTYRQVMTMELFILFIRPRLSRYWPSKTHIDLSFVPPSIHLLIGYHHCCPFLSLFVMSCLLTKDLSTIYVPVIPHWVGW